VVGVLFAAAGTSRAALEAVAREFSPRIEVLDRRSGRPGEGGCDDGGREIALDLGGLTRLFGDARTLAQELRRTAADRGLRVRVAIAGTTSAARLLARHRAGITIVEPGTEATALAALPLSLLAAVQSTPDSQRPTPTANDPNVLRQWGLRTLGELAALPTDGLLARLGQAGVEWQRVARGEDARPLVPAAPEERFEQALDLEWPIDGLEPLSFVLGRLLEPLEAHLERRGRGAAILHVRLHLVDKTIHARSLQLPAPMRDARALRTLALLDLESHPPAAAIDRVIVAVDPTPGRVVQFSLLARALPSPEQLSTLLARLAALMGEGRCGSPASVDTWQPGAFATLPFAPRDSNAVRGDEPQRHRDTEIPKSSVSSVPLWFVTPRDGSHPTVALRRFRVPIPARVRVEDGRPVHVTIDRRGLNGGRVTGAAGPWRTSGNWWMDGTSRRGAAMLWERDEWDVSLAGAVTYRIFRERTADAWFVEGIVD
jgi:protein ImuB